jgi:hypothetical protein
MKKFDIKGYSIFFKGKLGRGGGARKKIFFVKSGFNSLSNGTLRFNYKKFILITSSGVLGCCINIFF